MYKRIIECFKGNIKANQFNAIRISVASPEQIRSISYGEVKKTETINYRTFKPERDGLFCARIFGPVQDWACICGKYKRMKHRGIICEKCGVEVIESRVRRERMGHIDLVSPVVHMWYLRGTPSYLASILDVTVKDLEKVVYFESCIVISQGKSPYLTGSVIGNAERDHYVDRHPEDMAFNANMGAEAIKKILSSLDLHLELEVMREAYKKNGSIAIRAKIMKRMKIVASLYHGKIRPEWMILDILPVIAPDLRPLVPLDGGRFASSDLNELYRRVINRNIRLKRLMEINAPNVIIKNEKRMLQESIDALIDNNKKTQPVRASKRPLKSLSDMLRGKQGRFRQNLLGKRVDYSARSVIVVDPSLKIDQCGIPKLMALELFKSHVLCELIKREIAPNIRVARKIIEDKEAIAWDILEDIVKDYPVLLNRAPTLHRLGIQAFYPILVDEKAVKIHPMVTSAYNADFDGDQMGVYIPLSKNSILECKHLIMSSLNLLSSQNARPVSVPSQDMAFGLHYLTKMRCNVKGEDSFFSSAREVVTAYQCNAMHLHARIKVRIENMMVETSVGRILIYNALPEGSDINWVNKIMNVADMAKMVELMFYRFGREKTIISLDKIKELGFGYATFGGISFSYEHLISPKNREKILEEAENQTIIIEKDYSKGTISASERYNKLLGIWDEATKDIASDMMIDLEDQNRVAFENKDGSNKEFNFLFMALESRARGSKDQIKQLVGMRGLMAKPSGEIMPNPVKSNFKNGLSVFEYFISTHGARKGQADTALKTANAGYLTRRLVDVAQDVIITKHDCQTQEYLIFEDLMDNGEVVVALGQRVYGKIAMEDVRDPITQELLVTHGDLITREDVERIKDSAVLRIKVRSVVKCKAKRGVCALCYGMDLSKNKLVDIGLAVGIIAAQSIGEPGTQLTMRTFHIGGTASLGDKTASISKHKGRIKLEYVKFILNKNNQKVVVTRKAKLYIMSPEGKELQKHNIEYGSLLFVDHDAIVNVGDKLIEADVNNRVLVNEYSGEVHFSDLIPNITIQNRYDETTEKSTTIIIGQRIEKHQPAIVIKNKETKEEQIYYLPIGSVLNIEAGDMVVPGDILVKIPKEASKTKDITGGLPKIAELFEARMPKDPCVIAEISGRISIGTSSRGIRKISVIGIEKTVEYSINRSKQINFVEGDFVMTGDMITNGAPILHDLINIMGVDYTQYYLVNQIQGIYKSQGVHINDRHFELIVRQMTRKVRISDGGDTNFLIGDKVDKIHLENVNYALIESGKKPAKTRPVLMGITLASLGTESFISAASFQETTRIIAESAISSQVDYLYGLKENVIIGKLIPAGTGLLEFRKKYIGE